MRWLLTMVALASLMGTGVAESEPLEQDPDAIGYWTGDAAFTTETFETNGPIRITLGAWCFEAVGFVGAVVYDAAGEEVGEVRVLGEGIEEVVLDTVPGEYYLEVTVSHLHIYTWELLVQAAEPEVQAAGNRSR